MMCPTCGHTLERVTGDLNECEGTTFVFHCPRCGTMVKKVDDFQEIWVPKLVQRVKDLLCSQTWKHEPWLKEDCQKLGITEAIYRPEDR